MSSLHIPRFYSIINIFSNSDVKIFHIQKSVNIFDGNDSNNSSSTFLSSPITMIGIYIILIYIGFAIIVFLFLVPIFLCLLYVLKKMLFITKIKSWHILDRP